MRYDAAFLGIAEEQKIRTFQIARDSVARLMISKVIPRSQAEALRLEIGDVILKFNGEPVASYQEFAEARFQGPEIAEMELLRDNKKFTVSVSNDNIGVLTETCYE
jgi:S1-C subfamily serine protease